MTIKTTIRFTACPACLRRRVVMTMKHRDVFGASPDQEGGGS